MLRFALSGSGAAASAALEYRLAFQSKRREVLLSAAAKASADNLPGFAAKIGGAERNRTAGLLIANEALSQLSYSPSAGLGHDGQRGRGIYGSASDTVKAGTFWVVHQFEPAWLNPA